MLARALRHLRRRLEGPAPARPEPSATGTVSRVPEEPPAPAPPPPLPFELGPAEREDLESLRDIYRHSVRDLTTRDCNEEQRSHWAARADQPEFTRELAQGLTLVARLHGEPVAFAQLHPADTLRMLYVHPRASGLGISTLLAQYLEDEARIAGVTRLHAQSSRTARRFFLRMGFEEEGTDEPIGWIRMSKKL